MILYEEGVPDLESLHMEKYHVTSSVIDIREKYAKLALMLIFPFRVLDDMKDKNSGLYWESSIMMRESGVLRKDSLQILQNIQDQIQCKKLKTYYDMLVKRTTDPVIDNNNKLRNIQNEEDGFGMSIDDMSALIEAHEFASTLDNVHNEKGMNGRTF